MLLANVCVSVANINPIVRITSVASKPMMCITSVPSEPIIICVTNVSSEPIVSFTSVPSERIMHFTSVLSKPHRLTTTFHAQTTLNKGSMLWFTSFTRKTMGAFYQCFY